MKTITVKKDDVTLQDYLQEHYGKKNVKKMLKFKEVALNGSNEVRHDTILHEGDTLTIGAGSNNSGLDILYEDDEFVVIDKPAGLLSISGGGQKEKTAYHQVSQYLKAKDARAKVFVLHRLDRDTSGVLVFAKNEKIKNTMQERWNEIVTDRGYYALCEGVLKPHEGKIVNYLKESKTQHVYIAPGGKKAITNYRVLQQNGRNSLVEVFLETGRKNQIRVTLESLKCPIVGDKKYSSVTNPLRRLGLHAFCFGFVHPINHKKYYFETKMPKEFEKLFK